MVIKFDHISYSAPINDELNVRNMFGNYKLVFEERSLENLDIKSGYFGKWHDKHNILMLESEGLYPVELTLYDDCEGINTAYSMSKDAIEFMTADVTESRHFYEVFDFVSDGNEMVLKPMLDTGSVKIRLIETEKSSDDILLDRIGFGSLAFVVDSIEKYAERLNSTGYMITETKSLSVNGKMLKIAFASGKCGEIVELIGVR